jgi:hypothetical protein
MGQRFTASQRVRTDTVTFDLPRGGYNFKHMIPMASGDQYFKLWEADMSGHAYDTLAVGISFIGRHAMGNYVVALYTDSTGNTTRVDKNKCEYYDIYAGVNPPLFTLINTGQVYTAVYTAEHFVGIAYRFNDDINNMGIFMNQPTPDALTIFDEPVATTIPSGSAATLVAW